MLAASIDLDDVVARALRNVYEKKLRAGDLDAGTWAANVEKLWAATSKGMGISTGYQASTSNELAAALRQNLFVFGAFKNHHMVGDIVGALTDPSGNVRSFADFKKAALAISGNYNGSWLKTEYDTAIASGQMAVKWQDFQQNKRALPFLRYETIGDSRVRPAHRALDGVTRHIDDPFWETWFPPNGWACRCDVAQVAGGKTPVPKVLPDDKQVPLVFRHNPGATGQVFSAQHPYFQQLPAEHRANVMRGAGQLIFDNYAEAEFWKNGKDVLGVKYFRGANTAGDLGLDSGSGGFIVLHKGHSPTGLADELPVCKILRANGGMCELLDESDPKSTFDLFWDGHFWEIKRLKKASNPNRAIRDYFRNAKGKGKFKLLIHVDMAITRNELMEAIYQANREQPAIKLVQIIGNNGDTFRLTPEMMKARDWYK